MKQRIPPRIVATRHLNQRTGVELSCVVIDCAPTTLVCQLQAIMGGWWRRSGGYPVGRDFGSRIG